MNSRTVIVSLLFLIISAGNFLPLTAIHAATPENFKLTASSATSHQLSSGLDGGSDVSVSRLSLTAGAAIPTGTEWQLSLNADYNLEDYDFSNLNTPVPWNTINRAGIGARLSYKLTDVWNVGFSPFIQSSGEDGAAFDDSLIYGGIVSASYIASQNLIVGLGMGVIYRLEETKALLAIFFSWKISDKLRLGNSFRYGSASPAGLELTYYHDKNWEMGIGGAYRSSRFRLAKDGPEPGGVGEETGWPVYAHVKYNINNQLHIDLTSSWILDGKIRIADRNGNKIRVIGYNTAPEAGLNIGASF